MKDALRERDSEHIVWRFLSKRRCVSFLLNHVTNGSGVVITEYALILFFIALLGGLFLTLAVLIGGMYQTIHTFVCLPIP